MAELLAQGCDMDTPAKEALELAQPSVQVRRNNVDQWQGFERIEALCSGYR